MDIRIGYGYDAHRLQAGRKLILGGVNIKHSSGLLGHSDADVLYHAISDSLLGALALGDIGKHFPDNDASFLNIDSGILLSKVYTLIKEKGYKVSNIDSTIRAQKPKLAPYLNEMIMNISRILEVEPNRISVKASTTEKMGFEGTEEGISASAVVILAN